MFTAHIHLNYIAVSRFSAFVGWNVMESIGPESFTRLINIKRQKT